MITLAVIALPWSMARLLRFVGADRWWALLGFPLALGFSFQWGFFSWIIAVSLFLLVLPSTLAYAQRPTLRGGVVVAAAGAALFFAHGLILLLFLFLFLFSSWQSPAPAGNGRWPRRRAVAALLPLRRAARDCGGVAADGPAGGDRSWRAVSRATLGLLVASTIEWLSLSTGASFEPAATGFGCAAVALLVAAGLRPSRERLRWIPFAVAAACTR